ncbi:MAG: S1 family peptidase, partial [Bacillota bacterium]
SDRSLVESLSRNPRFVELGARFGTILTDEELMDVENRLSRLQLFQAELQPLLENQFASIYSGSYVDNQNAGRIVIGLTRITDEVKDAIHSLSRDLKHNVELRTQEFTLVELHEKQKEILQDVQFLEEHGIVSIGLDVKGNRVTVGVQQMTPQLVHQIHARHGSRMITVIPDQTQGDSRSAYTRPLLLGLRIDFRDWVTNATGYCTLGAHGILNGFPYVITANHCGGLTRAWYQGGSNIGVWVQFNPKGTRRADAGLVSEQQASWATGRMYGENPITTVQPKGQNVVGELVCMSGASSGFTCGEIIDTSYNYKIEDGWYYDQLRATYSRAGGDSGAPVYLRVSSTTTVLKGIHSGHSSGNAVFSHIGWVISDHGLSGIVTE